MTMPLQVSPASAWKQQTWCTALPSGKVVELRKPDVYAVIADNGAIPDTVFEMLVDPSAQPKKLSAKALREQIKVMLVLAKTVVPDAVVNPRVVTDGEPDYEAGEIHIRDMDEQDRLFIVQWALQGGDPEAALARFLEAQQGAGLPPAQNMPAVRPASEPANGHNEPADSV